MSKNKVMVELPDNMIEEASLVAVSQLQKKVKTLEQKLQRRDEKIRKLQGGMDISKERRQKLKELAEYIVEELNDAGWYEIDKYYEN